MRLYFTETVALNFFIRVTLKKAITSVIILEAVQIFRKNKAGKVAVASSFNLSDTSKREVLINN